MRNRVGTSDINRRKLIKKAATDTASSQAKPASAPKKIKRITRYTTEAQAKEIISENEEINKTAAVQAAAPAAAVPAAAAAAATTVAGARGTIKIVPTKVEPLRKNDSIVVPASDSIAAAGLSGLVPAVSTLAASSGTPSGDLKGADGGPVSSDFLGRGIKVDDDGRMDLSEISKMNVAEAGVYGTTVPTDQFLGMGKDVIYGVASQNQRTRESGLDLLINPLIRPFVDERMVESGVVTQSNWYWPEELKADWDVLPEFMQKGSGPDYRPETRSFVDGMGGFFGNVGAVIQSPLAGEIAADEWQTSQDRFNTNDATRAYYIGSALGEIPYFIIGGGQVKAAATIAAKTAGGVMTGSVKGVSGARVVAQGYKVERAMDSLEKAVKSHIKTGKPIPTKTINNAVKQLKKGYGQSTKINREAIDKKQVTGILEDMAEEKIRATNQASDELDKFKNLINKIKDTPADAVDDKGNVVGKSNLVNELNTMVVNDLLPQTKKYKNKYVAESVKVLQDTSEASIIQKIGRTIAGAPDDVSKRIDSFFNQEGSTLGDKIPKLDFNPMPVAFAEQASETAAKEMPNIEKGTIKQAKEIFHKRVDAGEYEGVFGRIKLERELVGNTVNTILGIEQAKLKLDKTAQLISRVIPTTHTITKAAQEDLVKRIDEEIVMIKNENVALKIAGKNSEQMKDDPSAIKSMSPEQQIKENELKIEKLESSKKTSFEGLNFSAGPPIVTTSKTKFGGYTREGKKSELTEPTLFRYDFEELAKEFPELGKSMESMAINVAVRPSVNIRKTMGIIHGTIGEGTEMSMDFWINKMDRKDAIKAFGGDRYVSRPSLWKQIGLKKINTPLGRYRTLMPWKANQQEDIITIYQARDGIRTGEGIDTLVTVSALTDEKDLKLMKLAGFIEDTSTKEPAVNMLGGGIGGDKKVFKFSQFGSGKLDKMIQELRDQFEPLKDAYTGDRRFGSRNIDDPANPESAKNQPIKDPIREQVSGGSGRKEDIFVPTESKDIDRINVVRAMIENRPQDAKMYAQNIIDRLSAQKKYVETMYARDNIDFMLKWTKQSDEADIKARETVSEQKIVDDVKQRMKDGKKIDLPIEAKTSKGAYDDGIPDYKDYEDNMKIIKIKKDAVISGIDQDLAQWKKYLDPENIIKEGKAVAGPQWGTPEGTLFSTPMKNLERTDISNRSINQSGIVKKDLKNDDYYYISSEGTFKIDMDIKDFAVDMVQPTKMRVAQSTRYFEGQASGMPQMDGTHTNFIRTTKDKLEPGKYATSGEWTFGVSDELGEVTYPYSAEMFSAKDNIDKRIADKMIFLDDPSSMSGKLTELTDQEINRLGINENYGDIQTRVSELAKNIDESAVTKTTKTKEGADKTTSSIPGLIEKNIKTGSVQKIDSVFTSIAKKNKDFRSYLFGERWMNVDTTTLKPDKWGGLPGGDSDAAFIPRLGFGDARMSTGYTDLGRLFNVDNSKGITQGNTPGGWKINPVYEVLNTNKLRKEVSMDETASLRSILSSDSEKTNYKIMEEKVRAMDSGLKYEIEKGDPEDLTHAMFAFRKTMVKLYYEKVLKEKIETSAIDKLAKDPDKYKEVIVTKLDNINNKYIRTPTKKDWKLRNVLKTKEEKNEAFGFINPEFDFQGTPLATTINKQGKLKNFVNSIRSEMITVESDKQRLMTRGGDIDGSSFVNNMSRIINWGSRKLTNEKVVSAEQANPYTVDIFNKIIKTIPGSELPRDLRKAQQQAFGEGSYAEYRSLQRVEEFLIEGVEESKKNVSKADKKMLEFRADQLNAIKETIKNKELSEQTKKQNILNIARNTMNQSYSMKQKADKYTASRPLNIGSYSDEINYEFPGPVGENYLSSQAAMDDPDYLNRIFNIWDSSDEGGIPSGPGSGTPFDIIYFTDRATGKTEVIRGKPTKKDLRDGEGSVDPYYTPTETEFLLKGLLSVRLDNPSLLTGNSGNILRDLFAGSISTAQAKQATSSPAGFYNFISGPGSPMKSFMQNQKVQQVFKNFQNQKTDSVLSQSQKTKAASASATPEERVGASIADSMTQRLIEQQQQTGNVVGLKSQAAGQTSTVGTAYAQSKQQPQQSQQPPAMESPYPTGPLMVNPQPGNVLKPKNVIDQTITDIQKTLTGITAGTNKWGPQSTKGISISSTATALTPSTNLLEGLNLGVNVGTLSAQTSSQSSDISLASMSGLLPAYQQELRQVLSQQLGQVQNEMYKTSTADRIFPNIKPRVEPARVKQQKITPTRIFPIAPGIPRGLGPSRIKRPYTPKGEKRTKKTWWQTPENWWEPYYWGGKDQQGSGYVTFTGQEPGKVKKYEKKHFGIGVGDTPFGIKGKWF